MRISDWSSDVCSSDLELAAIVALGKPSVVVGDRPAAEGVPVTSVDKIAAAGNDGADLPDAVAAVAKAPTSGGSTGRPKLILSGAPGLTPAVTPEIGDFGLEAGSIVLLPGPLYHNAPFRSEARCVGQGGINTFNLGWSQ